VTLGSASRTPTIEDSIDPRTPKDLSSCGASVKSKTQSARFRRNALSGSPPTTKSAVDSSARTTPQKAEKSAEPKRPKTRIRRSSSAQPRKISDISGSGIIESLGLLYIPTWVQRRITKLQNSLQSAKYIIVGNTDLKSAGRRAVGFKPPPSRHQ